MSPPIPHRPSGYRLGQCNAPAQVEVFVDIECPFSKKAWHTLCAIADRYPPDQVSLVVHPTVLADHRQSWDVTCAAIAMAKEEAPRVWQALSYLYDRQSSYSQDAFNHCTRTDLHRLLAGYAQDFAHWPDPDDFIERLTSSDIETAAKVSVRFSIVRGVWSTPTFFVNGSKADQLSSSSTLVEWNAVLSPLLSNS